MHAKRTIYRNLAYVPGSTKIYKIEEYLNNRICVKHALRAENCMSKKFYFLLFFSMLLLTTLIIVFKCCIAIEWT